MKKSMHYSYYLCILILLILIFKSSVGHESICSSKFCTVYTAATECQKWASNACDEDRGEIFSSEVPCNCCDVCMEYIGEDEHCSIGSPDTPPPMMMCGPRLTCKQIGEEYRCKKMKTPCFQGMYNKTTGENKPFKYVENPICDGDGNFGPIKCNVNQTCFCLDQNGRRIFGEAIYTESTNLIMNCECSRANDKFNNMFKYKYPGLFARCLGDGSYDQLQCINDTCICVETESGSPVDKISYNLTKTTYKNIPCFDSFTHFDWNYFYDCEQDHMSYLDEVHKTLFEKIYPIDIAIEQCQPDGWFKSIKENSKFKFCVNKYNMQIGSYSVPKDSKEATAMNCKCARTQDLLKRNKIETPECCPNGNFKKIQCRSIDDTQKECYCVDEDGIQITMEVSEDKITNLSCYKDKDICF